MRHSLPRPRRARRTHPGHQTLDSSRGNLVSHNLHQSGWGARGNQVRLINTIGQLRKNSLLRTITSSKRRGPRKPQRRAPHCWILPIITNEAIMLCWTILSRMSIDGTLPTIGSFVPFATSRSLRFSNTTIHDSRRTISQAAHLRSRLGGHGGWRRHQILPLHRRWRLQELLLHHRRRHGLTHRQKLGLRLIRSMRWLPRPLLLPLRPWPQPRRLHHRRRKLLLQRREHGWGHRRKRRELVLPWMRHVRRETRLARRILKRHERRRPSRRTELSRCRSGSSGQRLVRAGMKLSRTNPLPRRRRVRLHGRRSRRTGAGVPASLRMQRSSHAARWSRRDGRKGSPPRRGDGTSEIDGKSVAGGESAGEDAGADASSITIRSL